MRRTGNSGQATLEFVIAFSTILLPVSMMIVFTAQLLWVWHTAVDFTREGTRYAATHCWMGDGSNVASWMRQNFPATPDRDQFINGTAQIEVNYYTRDPDTGSLTEFTCDSGECSPACIPDTVRVRIVNYEYRPLFSYLGLPAVAMPDFQTQMPMESAGCNAESGECLP